MTDEGVFRPRAVFRPKPYIVLYGTGTESFVNGGIVAAAIAFGGTALGSTTVTDGGTAAGSIAFSGSPITSINIEVSAAGSITIGGSAIGYGFLTRTASGPVVFAGTARADPFATGPIVFGGNATAALAFFTAEVEGPIVFSGATVNGTLIPSQVTGGIVFGGTAEGEVSGVVYEGTADVGLIEFGGTAAGENLTLFGDAAGAIVLGGTATAVQPIETTCTIEIADESYRIVIT